MIDDDWRISLPDISRDIHFRLIGSYHVNRYMSYFKQTSIVIDALQNHIRSILNTELPHPYYTGTTS